MYEQFTDRARKVMQLANQEAQRFNHEYIGVEHILLGLVKKGDGVGCSILTRQDVDLKKVRLEVEKLIQAGPDMITMGKLPLTPKAKKIIETADEERRSFGHEFLGTEHLLLALTSVPDTVASSVLSQLGIELDKLRDEVVVLLGTEDDDHPVVKRMTAEEQQSRLTRKALAKKRKKRRQQELRERKREKKKQTASSFSVSKLCDQIRKLESADRMEALLELWQDEGFANHTPRLLIEVNSCQRMGDIIEINIEVTNVSLSTVVITGYNYYSQSHRGDGTCYCFCEPGKLKGLTLGIRSSSDEETTVSLIGFNPQNGFHEDGGEVIHGFVAKVDATEE